MHSYAGYTVALLVLFRIVWGVIGSRYARFSDFLVRPGESIRYFMQLLRGKAKSHVGHNPAGAAMIVLMLFSLLVTALSGISLFALEGSGPLADTFVSSWPGGVQEDIHGFFADFSVALVIVHVTGVVFSSLLHRENLIKAMITGKKTRGSGR